MLRAISKLRKRRDDRGAVLVEAALVFPLLMLLVFGIMEYGLLFRTNLSLSESTRAGTRVGAAQPRLPAQHENAAAAVSGALSSASIPGGSIEELIIYKADPKTGRTINDLEPENCTTDCVRYGWSSTNDEFVELSGTWNPATQSACGDIDSTDFYGVYIRARYDFITGFFGESATLTEHSIMRLEPLPLADTCEP
jgi:hypothetical protein